MPNKLFDSLNPLFEQAKKDKKLLFLRWSAPWSLACKKWNDTLNATEEWQALKDELVCLDWNRDWSPELDQGIQAFVQDRAGMAGWPLNLFLDPETRTVVFASPSMATEDFLKILRQLIVAWKVDPTQLRQQALKEAQEFSQKDPMKFFEQNFSEAKDELLDKKVLFRYLTPLEQSIDLTTGFVGKGSSFLFPDLYRSLMAFDDLSRFGEMALLQLAKSPQYDVVGGGFFRSLEWNFEAAKQASQGSFDSKWVRSRSTEKLLVENCEMLSLYTEAFKKTENPFYSQVAHEIIELIMEDFRMPGTTLSLASAVTAPEDFYEVTGKDLLEAVLPKDRQAAQLFFGLNEGRTLPYLSTDLPILSEYLGEEQVDLRLNLLGAKRALKEHRVKNNGAHLKLCPPTRISELSALRSLTQASFSFDTPRLTSLCEALVEKYASEYSSETWSLREKSAMLRGYTSMARLYSAQRDGDRAKAMFVEAEKLILELKDPLFLEARYESGFLGTRVDLCDHTGSSGFASLMNGILDFNALQKLGLRGEYDLPVDISAPLSWSLAYVRTMGVYSASIYGVAMRYLRDHKEAQA